MINNKKHLFIEFDFVVLERKVELQDKGENQSANIRGIQFEVDQSILSD